MPKLSALIQSYRFLVPVAAVSLIGAVLAVIPAADFVANRSVSPVSSFLVIGACMLLIVLTATAQTALLRRAIWGRSGQQLDDTSEALDALQVRSMGMTGTKLAFVFAAVAAANTLLLDFVGQGVLILNTREHYTLTLLRSEDPADRYRAVDKAIYLTGNPRITRELIRVVSTQGTSREWAAYALGARLDEGAREPLRALLSNGAPVEQAAAALALARLKDFELVPGSIEAFDSAGSYQGDLVAAIGMLSRAIAIKEEYADAAAEFLSHKLDSLPQGLDAPLVLWTLGELRSGAAVDSVEKQLRPESTTEELCTALSALGKIGAADSSPKLLELFVIADRTVRCPELVHRDFAGHEMLICEGMELPIRILYEVANIGDRRAAAPLGRIAADDDYSERARAMARQIAAQMKAAPLTQANGT